MAQFQRARKPEEKQERREAILATARALALEAGPIALSLNELGRRSGVSKPNIYRYFESREHVLLSLLVAEAEELVAELEGELKTGDDVPGAAAAIARAFLARPLLCQLFGMAPAILEHNLSVEAIAASKVALRGVFERAAGALVRSLGWLTAADAAWAAQSIWLYVSALWPAAHPSPAAAEVLARPEFALMKPDAEAELVRFVEVVLRGMR